MADDNERPVKRFRYETYNQQLSHLKVDVNKSRPSGWEELEVAGGGSGGGTEESQATPLNTALTDLSLLHLSLPYVTLTKSLLPLTTSLPLTLHSSPLLQTHFHSFLRSITPSSTLSTSGLDGALILYLKFFETIGVEEGLRFVEEATGDLVRIGGMGGLEVGLIERGWECLGGIFKLLAPGILATVTTGNLNTNSNPTPTTGPSKKSSKKRKRPSPSSSTLTTTSPTSPSNQNLLKTLYALFLPPLSSPHTKPHVLTSLAKVWSVLLRRARGAAGRGVVGVMVEGLLQGPAGVMVEGGEEGNDEMVVDGDEDETSGNAMVKGNDKSTSSSDLTPGLASLLAEGIKGTPNLLHSRGVQIYGFLLAHLMDLTSTFTSTSKTSTSTTPTSQQQRSAQAEALCKTMRYLTTAMVHHCASGQGEGMRGVYEVLGGLLAKVNSHPSESEAGEDVDMDEASTEGGEGLPRRLNAEQSRVVLRLVTTVMAVRKGQRLPGPGPGQTQSILQQYLHTLLRLSNTPILENPELRKEFLKAVDAALIAGKVKDWLSPGISLIKNIWDNLGRIGVAERVAWVRGLVKLGWKGVEGFLLGHVARIVPEALKTPANEVGIFSLLELLADKGYLDSGLSNVEGGQWKSILSRQVGGWFDANAGDIDGGDDHDRIKIACKAMKLCAKLHASSEPFLEPMTAMLESTSRSITQMTEVEASEEFASKGYNKAYLLACGLRTLKVIADMEDGGEKAVEAAKRVVGSDGGEGLVERWSWHRGVVAAVGEFADEIMPASIESSSLIANLSRRLNSEDPLIREGALRIIAKGKFPAIRNLDGDIIDPNEINVFVNALEVEGAGMSLQNVRERTTKIRKVGLVLQGMDLDGESHEALITAIITFLLGQLKVNFRPLYKDTIAVLAEIGKRFPDIYWRTAFRELELCQSYEVAALISCEPPAWCDPPDHDHDADEAEVEKQLICPNATKLEKVCEAEIEGKDDQDELEEVSEAQVCPERLVIVNYEEQILEVMGETANITEKHGRDIVPFFLRAVGSADNHEEEGVAPTTGPLSRRTRQTRTSNYLRLFTHFGNPKALYKADDVLAVELDILNKGENAHQNLALDCLFVYKFPFIQPYETRLKNLLVESKFRDELAKLPLGLDSDVIGMDHRAGLLPILIRLLYGIMISNKGRHSSNQGPTARKNAILSSLSQCEPSELESLANLMLSSFPVIASADVGSDDLITIDTVSSRSQIGFLTMLGDVLKHLSNRMTPYYPRLLSATIAITANAQSYLDKENEADDAQADDAEVDEDQVEEDGQKQIPARTIRSLAFRRLADFFRTPVSFDYTTYMASIFAKIISPRLARLPQENTQAPSAIMEIFATWSTKPNMYPFLVDYDSRVLSQLFACIGQPKVKPAVVKHVLDIAERLLLAAEEMEQNADFVKKYLTPYMSGLLDSLMSAMLAPSKTPHGQDQLLHREISVLSKISTYAQPGRQSQQLVELLLPRLRKPSKQVPESMKAEIASTLANVIGRVPDFANIESQFHRHCYNMVSTAFRSLHTRPARNHLVSLFNRFAEVDRVLQVTADVVSGLNAFSAKRKEEPDFDRRFAAYEALQAPRVGKWAMRQWLPILHNLVFYLQDNEELTIRTNSAAGLKAFIDLYGKADRQQETGEVLTHLVLPAVRDVLKNRHELVRAEALLVLAHAVKVADGLDVFAEMTPLLADGDEEANFFNNIYHLQVHRRARAIRRLAELASGGKIRDALLAGIFLPILGHFISGSTEKSDHTLINEAISSIGRLAGQLSWSRYQSLVLNYLRTGTTKGPLQKYYVRAITAILDNFHFNMHETVSANSVDDTLVAEIDQVEEDLDVAYNIKESARIAEYVTGRLLPALLRFVEQKDETEDSIRIPVAVGVVKVAMVLPVDIRDQEIGRVITVLSQILRSKDQDTRDLVKDTMCRIALTLGPDWLTRVIGEMKAALQRGPQLHVLAVVTHAILLHVTTEASELFADMDSAIPDVVAISAEVVWGRSGQDVVAEGFKTKMREVRGAASRGFDCFQLVSRLASPNRVSKILVPLKNIMQETSAYKPMQQVDEALRRISSGLNSNPRMGPIDLLRLCHTLVGLNAEFLRDSGSSKTHEKAVKGDIKVVMKRKDLIEANHYKENSQKFVGFGLDLFVTAFRRGKLDFEEGEILARLAPLVNAIGNALYSSSDFVLVLALKAAAAITKVPNPAVEKASTALIEQMVKIIKKSGGAAGSEVAQTAIKSLAVIIRDCKTATIKDKHLIFLIEQIGPDVEEHETQPAAFALLRAILTRRFVVPEIYDLMEKIASIMVTSQSSVVQDMARSAMLQFMLDYPQGKGRLKTTMQFLASNLSYQHETGRISVMELLAHCFTKFSETLVESYSDLFFVALLMVVVNDESEKCRAMGAELLKQLLGRYTAEKIETLVGTLEKWATQKDEDATLARSSALVAGLLVQALPELDAALAGRIVISMNGIIQDDAMRLRQLEDTEVVSAFDQVDLEYTLPYQALNTLSICIGSQPEVGDNVTWSAVVSLLLFPHDWVRLASTKLLVSRYSQGSQANLDQEKYEVVRKCCLVLSSGDEKGSPRSPPTEKLCGQIVRLVYIIAKDYVSPENSQNGHASTNGPQLAGNKQATDNESNVEEADPMPADGSVGGGKKLLNWLMSRLSFVARGLIINKPTAAERISNPVKWTPPLLAVLQVFAGLVDAMSVDQATGYLKHVCEPVYRILDEEGGLLPSETDNELANLTMLATELRDLISQKVGVTTFAHTWEAIRSRTVERRTRRRTDAGERLIREPELERERRAKRAEMKIDNRKRKTKAFADAKRRERPTKRRDRA